MEFRDMFSWFSYAKSVNAIQLLLVGGFNSLEKYARQIGNLPQIGLKIRNM